MFCQEIINIKQAVSKEQLVVHFGYLFTFVVTERVPYGIEAVKD